MSTQNSIGSSPVGRHLIEAQKRAEAGNYSGALAAVKEAKLLEPKNVYILAFEKQAEQLNSYDAAKTLTEEQRTDVLESFPSIVEKAVELSRTSSGVTNISNLGKPASDADRGRQEKAAALEWLKNQYFQHAHEYVRKGEYQHALAEIRRVYIIDPNNRVAKDFEKQIDQLAQLKTQHTTKTHPAIVPPSPTAPPVLLTPEVPEPPRPDSEPMPTMTEEWSSPQQLLRAPQKQAVRSTAPPAKKKSNRMLVILLVVSFIILCTVVYIYYQRAAEARKNPVEPRTLPPSSSEQFIGAPAETTEQTFIVTPSPSDSTNPTPDVQPQDNESRQNSQNPPGQSSPGGRTSENLPQRQAPPDDAQRYQSGAPLQATSTIPQQPTGSLTQQVSDTAGSAPFVPFEREARILQLQHPNISYNVYQRAIEGQAPQHVVIQVQIDTTGQPVQTLTLRSTNDLLIEPAIDAVMRSQFAPAEVSTGRVTSWLTIPFKFASK